MNRPSSAAASGRVGVKVRYPQAPPPVAGFADRYSLLDRGTYHELTFLDSPAGRVVSRLTIEHTAFVEHLWGTSEAFYSDSLKWMTDAGLAPVTPSAHPGEKAVNQVPAFACNLFRLARVSGEAVFEAYYASPRFIHEANGSQSTKPVDAEAICRVQLPLATLIGLLAQVKEGASRP